LANDNVLIEAGGFYWRIYSTVYWRCGLDRVDWSCTHHMEQHTLCVCHLTPTLYVDLASTHSHRTEPIRERVERLSDHRTCNYRGGQFAGLTSSNTVI